MGHWFDIQDIRVSDTSGTLLGEAPKFLRCFYGECAALVTYGQIEATGACTCGGRKYRPARKLSEAEKQGLLSGAYPLSEWEQLYVGCDEIGNRLTVETG